MINPIERVQSWFENHRRRRDVYIAGGIGSIILGTVITNSELTGNVVANVSAGLVFGGVGIAGIIGAAIEQNKAENEDHANHEVRAQATQVKHEELDGINVLTASILEAGGVYPVQDSDGSIRNMTAADLPSPQ